MSAVNSVKLKSNCNAVSSGSFINQSVVNSSIAAKQTPNITTLINSNRSNNGSNLNQSIKLESPEPPLSHNLSDVQKVLKQEQELLKQLYSGSNVAPGWLRVNHNNKVIYISPSGIGLASLKQVKDYLLTRGTCKCGLPFPLRVELFFNFNTEVPTVPLKAPIDSIKFDPTCQHRKKLTSTNNNQQNDSGREQQQSTSQSSQQQPVKKLIKPQKRSSGECLLPSYVTSKIISQSSTSRNMIVNSSSNTLATNSIQPTQIMQSKSTFQPQYVQHETQPNGSVVMRIISKEAAESAMMDESKLPPWKKNSMQNQKQQQHQQMSNGIPIFQINGQMIAVDQQNQQFGGQQIQIIEQKDGEQKTIIRRRPTFKEDPTGYLNQQTALLHNTITTLHSPDGTTTITSPAENTELRTQRQQFIQQIVKAAPPGNQVTTIGGQTVTHMSNGIVQIQNCDIKQQNQTQPNKPLMMQEQVIQQNKFIRTNPKGRPPKNAATIAKRLVAAMSQESPVSSSTSASMGSPVSGGNVMKITKANTPDITSSSSHADVTETMQVQSSFDATEIVKFARNSTTQELIRTSMTQMVAGKTTNTQTTTAIRKQQQQQQQPQMTMMKKPQILTQVKTQCANPTQTNLGSPGGQQQFVMTSNGQQFIVMPQPQQSQQTQNFMLNNNAIVQFQNSSPKLIQSPQNSGNIIIQTNPLTGQNYIVNQQPQQQHLVLQNGQIITTNGGNLMTSPKGNILTMTSGNNGNGGKTIISGNNQLTSQMLGQQTVLMSNNNNQGMPQSTIIHDPSSFMSSNANMQQQQQQKIIIQNQVVGEKKKGRKRKIPLTDNTQQQQHQQQNLQPLTISQVQQPNMIQMASPQSFQLSPNILVNKFQNQSGAQQIILQNGQTLIQQPVQFQSAPIMALSHDGQLIQIQNPQFNQIINTPQGMMIRQAQAPSQQAPQKTIITNNGQQYIVQGSQFQLPTFTNSPMGFVVQQQHQNQQIIPQIITQPQIITHSTAQSPTTTVLTQQQAAQYITTTQQNNEAKRKIVATPKNTAQMQSSQSQKFFPAHQQRTTTMYTTTTSTKNAIPIVTTHQEVIEEPEEMEPEENCEELEMEESEENCEEMEAEELELSFEEDYKPDMIEELHHGTSQQILHGSAFMNDGGQFGIMNIDDIKIEMDEINDLNEYLNAIDEEDNRMTQMSLQQFGNSPPDTTTHSPRSPNTGDMLMHGSEKSNGSSEGNNNMVSSSEADSNVVSPECHQLIDSVQSPSSHHNYYQSNNIQHLSQQSSFSQQQSPQQYLTGSQPVFKLPMNIKSPPSSNIFDTCNRSPLMRPDSHESAENQTQYRDSSEENEDVPKKSDFDLLKESPPVNTIKPSAIDNMVKEEEEPSCPISPEVVEQQNLPSKEETSFKVGDLIWGVTRGCDAWPGKIVNGPDENEPTSSNCVWVKWFGGRQSIEMVQCSTLKSLSEGLEAHHAARKETRTGRKLNSHLERAIQKAMVELDKQSEEIFKTPTASLPATTSMTTTAALKSGKGNNNEKKSVTTNQSQKSTKSRMIKIAPAPSDNNTTKK